MNLVDSSGWIEFLTDGPQAGVFARTICDTASLLVPSVCLFEVYKIIKRRRSEEEAFEIAAQMSKGHLAPLDGSLAVIAADLSLQHGLSLADSIIFATAQRHQATLWTSDAHFKNLPGVNYLPKH